MSPDSKSLILGLISVVFWSTVATAFKLALKQVSFSELLAFSSSIAAFILFISLLITRKANLLFKLNSKEILFSVFIGFLNPFLYYLILFKAYSILPAQEALSLNYTWAIVLTYLSSVFQKKRISLLSYLSLFISFFGVLIIISKGEIVSLQPSDPLGAFLALFSAFIWGFSWILNVLSKAEDNLRLFLNFFFGSIFSFFYLFYFNQANFPPPMSVLPISYVGLFEMGITFLVWNKALKYSNNPAKVNNLIYLSPLLSIVFINIILKEPIHTSTVVGLFFILLGIAIQNFFPPKIIKFKA